MAKETGTETYIPAGYRWDDLLGKKGVDLKRFYKRLLNYLGEEGKGRIKEIYANAGTNIDEPKNLEKIIRSIDGLDWYSAKQEGLGDLYEGLLEKNANEKKSGAGQYFTPRPLINVMVRLVKPRPGERCGDPACGTFGFMIAADRYIKNKTDDLFDLKAVQQRFQRREAFSGMELVQDAYRLTLMNAMLHDIEGKIMLGDTLSDAGKAFRDYDVILTNPPFGTKKGGERPTRDDLTFPSSNIHTILRLPTGIFYAQGVKTNVLFFNRGKTEKENTKEVFFYDLRTNMPSLGKTHPLAESHFKEFEETFSASKKQKLKLERWNIFTKDEIRKKGNSLDLGLIRDDSVISQEDLPNPVESAEIAIGKLEQANDLLSAVIKELQICGVE
jgi:type I restriction enzyme M protein